MWDILADIMKNDDLSPVKLANDLETISISSDDDDDSTENRNRKVTSHGSMSSVNQMDRNNRSIDAVHRVTNVNSYKLHFANHTARAQKRTARNLKSNNMNFTQAGWSSESDAESGDGYDSDTPLTKIQKLQTTARRPGPASKTMVDGGSQDESVESSSDERKGGYSGNINAEMIDPLTETSDDEAEDMSDDVADNVSDDEADDCLDLSFGDLDPLLHGFEDIEKTPKQSTASNPRVTFNAIPKKPTQSIAKPTPNQAMPGTSSIGTVKPQPKQNTPLVFRGTGSKPTQHQLMPGSYQATLSSLLQTKTVRATTAGGTEPAPKFVIPKKNTTNTHASRPDGTSIVKHGLDTVKRKPIVYDVPSSRAAPAQPKASAPKLLTITTPMKIVAIPAKAAGTPAKAAGTPAKTDAVQRSMPLLSMDKNHRDRSPIKERHDSHAANNRHKNPLSRKIVNRSPVEAVVKPTVKNRVVSETVTQNGAAKWPRDPVQQPKAKTFVQRDPRQNRPNAGQAKSIETVPQRTGVLSRATGLLEPFNYGFAPLSTGGPIPPRVDDTPPIQDKEILAKLVLPPFASGMLGSEVPFSYLLAHVCRRFMHGKCSADNKNCRMIHQWPTVSEFRDKLARMPLQGVVDVYDSFVLRCRPMYDLYFNEFFTIFHQRKVDKLYDMVNDCILRKPTQLLQIFDALIEMEDGYANGLRKLVGAVKHYKAASNQLLINLILSPSNDTVGEFVPFLTTLSMEKDHGFTYQQINTMLRMCVENHVGELSPVLANLIEGRVCTELSADLLKKYQKMNGVVAKDENVAGGDGANTFGVIGDEADDDKAVGDEAVGAEADGDWIMADKVESAEAENDE